MIANLGKSTTVILRATTGQPGYGHHLAHCLWADHMGKGITQSGKTYDFKVAKRFFVMTRAWKTSLVLAKSHDE